MSYNYIVEAERYDLGKHIGKVTKELSFTFEPNFNQIESQFARNNKGKRIKFTSVKEINHD